MWFHGTLKRLGESLVLSVVGAMELREDGEKYYEGIFLAPPRILAELQVTSLFRLEIDGVETWDIRVLGHLVTSNGSYVLCEFRTQGDSLDPP